MNVGPGLILPKSGNLTLLETFCRVCPFNWNVPAGVIKKSPLSTELAATLEICVGEDSIAYSLSP